MAGPASSMIVLIIGGIMLGIVTAVEASGITVVYTLLLNFVIHRTVPLRALPGFLIETAQTTSAIMLLAASAALRFAVASTGIPAAVTAIILAISEDPVVVMLIIKLLLVTYLPAQTMWLPRHLALCRSAAAIGDFDVTAGAAWG